MSSTPKPGDLFSFFKVAVGSGAEFAKAHHPRSFFNGMLLFELEEASLPANMTLARLLLDKESRESLSKPAIRNVKVLLAWLLATTRLEVAEWLKDPPRRQNLAHWWFKRCH